MAELRVLYQLSDQDLTVGSALIYEMEGFDPSTAELIYTFDDFAASFWVAAPTEYFLLEVGRTVHHFHNGVWTTGVVAESQMLRVWGLSPNDAYLFGTEGKLYRYDGNDWSSMTLPLRSRLHDMHGRSADRLYAVGDLGTLLRGDGANWIAMISNWTTASARSGPDRTGPCTQVDERNLLRLLNEERMDFDMPDMLMHLRIPG